MPRVPRVVGDIGVFNGSDWLPMPGPVTEDDSQRALRQALLVPGPVTEDDSQRPLPPLRMPSGHWPSNVMPNQEIQARFGGRADACPFCASDRVGLFVGRNPHVTCVNCGADGPTPITGPRHHHLDPDHLFYQAVVAWNERRL